jgi:Tol biopolymer transport system component
MLAVGAAVAFYMLAGATGLARAQVCCLQSVSIPPSTARVSVASGGTQSDGNGPGPLSPPAVSGSGTFVAFSTWAANVVSGDTNGRPDTFVHDRPGTTTTRVSVPTGGGQATGASNVLSFSLSRPALSADGRFVAFGSDLTNLVPGDTNGHFDVFVHDRQTATTTRVSLMSSGAQETDGVIVGSDSPSISADGRFVAFTSDAHSLVSGDTNNRSDVFVRDRQTGITTRVSLSSGQAQATGGSSANATISADGRFVAFTSDATNLVSGDTNGQTDVFVRDRLNLTTTRVSVSSGQAQASGGISGGALAISADGRFVAFGSAAANLTAGDTNGQPDVFVRDRTNATTERVSLGAGGLQANGGSGSPALAGDGRYVAFTSDASNLVSGDTNNVPDVFVRTR